MSPRDSIQWQLEQKRLADSTRNSLRKIAIEKRQDSIRNVIELRRRARLKRADSLREVRLKIRATERKRNKEFVIRKKERQRYRDSIEAASKKAAAARKAYKKKEKKSGKKKLAVKKKSEKPINIETPKKRKTIVKTIEKKESKPNKEKKRKKRRKDIPIVTKNEKDKKEKTKKDSNKKVTEKKIAQKKKKPNKKQEKVTQKAEKKKRSKRRKDIPIVTKNKKDKKEKTKKDSNKKVTEKKIAQKKKKPKKKQEKVTQNAEKKKRSKRRKDIPIVTKNKKDKKEKTKKDSNKKVTEKKIVQKKKRPKKKQEKVTQKAEKKKRSKRRKDIPIVTKNKKDKKEKTKKDSNKKVTEKKIVQKKKRPKKKQEKVTQKAEKKKRSKRRKDIPIVTKNEKDKVDKKNISPPVDKKGSDSLEFEIKKKKVSIYKNEAVPPVYPKRIKIKIPPNEKSTFFSFTIGQSNYLGDLGGGSNLDNSIFNDLSFKENTYFYGLALSHLRKEAIGLRLSFVFGSIAGSDKNTFFVDQNDPSYYRFVRNLDFRSTINEGSLLLEAYPFKFLSYRNKLHNSYFQPYAMVGIGRYSFNPQGSYYDPILEEDVWVDLHPLQLEGQGMAEYPDRLPYKTTQWNIPYGVGLQYEISNSISAGIEYIGRILNTDYLDDVSTRYIDPDLYQNYLSPENTDFAKALNNKSKLIDANRAYKPGQIRGNPSNNDFYFSIAAKLTIRLNRIKKKKALFYRYDDSEICE